MDSKSTKCYWHTEWHVFKRGRKCCTSKTNNSFLLFKCFFCAVHYGKCFSSALLLKTSILSFDNTFFLSNGFYIFCFLKIFIVIRLQLSQFSPLCPPLPSPFPTPTINPHMAVHVHGSFIHVLWLDPSPSFHHYPLPPSPLVAFSLFPVSMPRVLFCSLMYFYSLGSSYMWAHMVFVFHHPAYFTQHNTLQFHPCCGER